MKTHTERLAFLFGLTMAANGQVSASQRGALIRAWLPNFRNPESSVEFERVFKEWREEMNRALGDNGL